jgi:1-acyl-sn-glycerol-3-phosphate acyltransferase
VLLRWRPEGRVLDPALPLLYLVTHVSWWDGYLLYLLNRHLGRDGYLMMEERQLRRYPFFRWVGCFPVDRDQPRRAAVALREAAGLLTGAPNRAVVVFPQGVIAPADRRPLVLQTGAARLARAVGRVLVLPVALRYEFLGDQHPVTFISAGPPLLIEGARDPRALTADFTARLTAEADRLREAVVAGDLADFRPILTGATSVNERFDRVRGWLGLGRPPAGREAP